MRTGDAQAAEDASNTNEFISFLQKFLLAFGGIALFVGAFVIANSLSITIAQRTREFATLRTLGASRRQVLTSRSSIEALVDRPRSRRSSGLLLGLGLAKGLFELFDAVGFTLPNSGLLFQTRTIVVSLLVGVVVTLLASLRPALRATRVPPIAAVREGATLPAGTLRALPHARLGAAHRGSGSPRSLYGLFGHGLGTTQVLLWMGLGTLADLLRRRAALVAARAAARRRPEPGGALGGVRLHRARLAVLPAARTGCSGTARGARAPLGKRVRSIRRRCAAEPDSFS